MIAPGPEPLPCCVYGLPMRRFAEDSYYEYVVCDVCGREWLEPKALYPGKIDDARADATQL